MAELQDKFKEISVERNIDASRKVRVGIIGTGWIAEAHALAYLQQPDVELVALADLVPGKAEAFAAKMGIEAKCYLSHTEMLADEREPSCSCGMVTLIPTPSSLLSKSWATDDGYTA